jgi:ribosomal protein S18 acetylase RimI-like enzyme
VRPLDDSAARAAFLYQITVAKNSRRRGYGRAMLTGLERRLATDGIEELRLNVFAGNEPARRLYASAGYEEVARNGPHRHLRKLLTAAGRSPA